MKIAITTPVFVKNEQHKHYLDLTTKSIVSRDHDIVFIPVENYIAPQLRPLDYVFVNEPEAIQIVKPEGQQSVSKAWNLGINMAAYLDCDYVLVINHDIVFKSNMVDRLVAFAESQPDAVMWTAAEYADLALLEEATEDENYSEHPHFSCFMVKPDFFTHVGEFDENLVPAYLEDGDMHARLALADKRAYIYGGARFYHFGSRTIKSDQEEWQKNTVSFPKNQQYFLEKWGHPPVNEVAKMREVYFKHPYNEADKPLSYWKKTSA
jgi:GT2 family glycosyltransferase